MKENLLLEGLTEGVLQEIGKFGLCPASYRQYQCAYENLKAFAAEANIESFCDDLFARYSEDIEGRYSGGALGRCRRTYLLRTLSLLRDYALNGTIEWKTYNAQLQPHPVSEQFLLQHSRFIDNLRSLGRSEHTIQSGRNAVRQFLLFLEDNGCSTLEMATSEMVPLFFQHLLSTYRATSIRIVASQIRCFLRFVEKAERLIRAVPCRFTRNKPIIPILSQKESEVLARLLQTRQIRFRDKAVILLAWQTGLRAADIVRIRLEDIDWVDDTISIIQSKTRIQVKLPLSADAGNALSAYILNERPRTDCPNVFVRSHPPFAGLSGHSACYAMVRRAFAHAGIRPGKQRKGTHLMRHSAASRMLAKGVPITTISSMLGHSDKASTDVYLSTDEARMRECALSLAEIPMNCGGLA